MKFGKILSFTLALVLMFSVFAPLASAEETIKIGGIGVLTGPYAQYGLAVKNGADLYIEQLNNKGGINGKKIVVIWEDTQGDPTVGINAYNKLVDNDGVVALIGPVLTGVSKAVAELSADIGIPMITPSATAYEVTTGRPNVFRTCFLDPFQAVAIAQYMNSEGLKNVASLYDNGDEYSTGLFNAFKAECEKLGLNVVAAESAPRSDVDFKSQLTNIKNANPEAVFLPYYGAPAALMMTQAAEIGLNTKFFGADGIADIVASISNKALLTNMIYSDHFTIDADSAMAINFIKDYEAKYGEKPTVSFAATAYDAAIVLTEAIKTAGSTDYAAVAQAIKASAVDGVSGKITFDDHNDPIKSVFFLSFDAEGNKTFIKQLDP